MEYKLTFLKGCPFVDYGEGLMLIDLGLPFSIADKGTIGFDGETQRVPRERGPINTPVLSDWFEQPVTGVIGGDILLGTPIKIDYKAGMLVTHYDGPVGQKIGQTSMGYSIVELSIDGVAVVLLTPEPSIPRSCLEWSQAKPSARVWKIAYGVMLETDLMNHSTIQYSPAMESSTKLVVQH